MTALFDKGKFEPIDEGFLTKSLDVFQQVAKIQTEYSKLDTDSFINEVRDSIVAKQLGYTQINTEKHGFDARRERTSIYNPYMYDYLEVKAASFDAKSLQATFNDTNLEKNVRFNVYCLWAKQSNRHIFRRKS